MKIYKSYVVPIKTTKENLDYFYECNRECAKVWNECIRLSKELWKNEQKYSDRNYLQTNLKGFSKVITAKSIQMVAHKYLNAIKAIQQAKKSNRADLKYPWRYKKNFNMQIDMQNLKIDYDKNIIRIPKPRSYDYIDERGKKKSSPIILNVKNIPQNVVQIELVYHGRLELSFNYWIEEEALQIESNNISAIDLGEIHSITSFDNMGNSNIITGRKIRSEQRFRNKELTYLNRRLSKCKKDSRNYKKYRRAINKLMNKSERKISNNIKKTAKMYSDYVLTKKIKTVIVGDLNNFNMNLKNRKNKKGSKQKVVQWIHGKVKEQLKYNLEKHGVIIKEISEAYTSQTCPQCGNKHKPTGRNYVCQCGFTMHRDLVGAYNILSKYINNGEIKPLFIKVKPIKYLRIDC
jgi:putative transposase